MRRTIKAGSIGLAILLVGCAAKETAVKTSTARQDVAHPTQAAPADTKLFQSPDGDFQLEYPASWQLLPSTEDLRFHARALLGLVSANVSTERVPPGTTLDSYVDKGLAEFERFPGVEVRSPIERRSITVNGTRAVRLGFTVTMPTTGSVLLHFDWLLAVVNNKGYVLTCGTGNAAAAMFEPVFDRIIASMRFTNVESLAQFETRALPGFTLALPLGTVRLHDSDYAHGAFGVAVADTIVGATWSPSEQIPSTGPELQAMADVLGAGIGPFPKSAATPVDVAGPDGKPLPSIHSAAGMWLTTAKCGARLISIFTMASHDGERVHRRVVRSFVCAPDAAEEASLGSRGSALVLNLPGWHIMATSPSRLRITDGQSVLLLLKDYPNVEASNLHKVLGPLAHAGGLDLTFAPPRDDRVDFTTKSNGETTVGWMRLFRCAARNELVEAFAKTEADAQSLYARVANARCRLPGEPAQVWPDAARP